MERLDCENCNVLIAVQGPAYEAPDGDYSVPIGRAAFRDLVKKEWKNLEETLAKSGMPAEDIFRMGIVRGLELYFAIMQRSRLAMLSSTLEPLMCAHIDPAWLDTPVREPIQKG
jgi:hypothetical protein